MDTAGEGEGVQSRKSRFNIWVRKIPESREWQLTLVVLPGEFDGQRNMVGYSPWGHTESDTTKRLRSNQTSPSQRPSAKALGQVRPL